MNRKTIVVAMAAAVLAIGGASAATNTTTFNVTLELENSCTVSVTDLDFGIQNDLTPAIPGSTTGSVTCTGAGPVSVDLDAGTGGGTITGGRQMINGANFIVYNLYTDGAHANKWGDGTGGTSHFTVTSTGGGTPDPFTVYGLTSANQNPKAVNLTYSDTITATVNF
jgi:spore coat protein U-like protein